MTGITAAVGVEMRKATASVVVRVATLLITAGVTALSLAMTLAAAAGNQQVEAQLGHLAGEPGGATLVGAGAQITAAGGLLGFGVTLSWIFGREFVDGTIEGLFALPVGRRAIAAAKLITYVAWCLVVAVALPVVLAAAGVAARLESPAEGWPAAMVRIALLVVLTALLAVPAAWAATLGRGLLSGITLTVLILVVAQAFVVAGADAWLPFAAPGLWSVAPEEVSAVQLGLVAVVPVIFGGATLSRWGRLQLN